MLSEQITTASSWVIGSSARRVLERTELLVPCNLQNGKVFCEGKYVEYEHLELHPVRLRGLDGVAVVQVDVRDLLACDVERELLLERGGAVQERGGVKVVGDVAGAEGELAGAGIAAVGLLFRDLRVLNDAVLVAAAGDDADRLGGVCLGDDLGGAVGLLLDAVAEEDRVGDAHEAIVDAVAVDVLDVACREVGEDGSR